MAQAPAGSSAARRRLLDERRQHRRDRFARQAAGPRGRRHPLYREGVRAIAARAELEVVGAAGHGREALARDQASRARRRGARRADAGPRRLRGPRRGREGRPRDARDLAVGLRRQRDRLRRRRRGRQGYLSKDADAAEIVDAIAAVARGETVLARQIQSALASQIQRQGHAAEAPELSQREREILVLIADGRSAPEIGARLHLSPATVKTHLQNRYEKLGVSVRSRRRPRPPTRATSAPRARAGRSAPCSSDRWWR